MFRNIDQKNKKLRSGKRYCKGFTILEVMIALSIFAFLMLYVSQFMHMEIRLFDKATQQDDLEQKARFAMLHIVDQIRTTTSPTFNPGPDDAGIYDFYGARINIKPTNVTPTFGTIHYDYDNANKTGKLMLKQATGDYLISDHIRWIKFEQAGSSLHLIKISILAKKDYDPNDPKDSDNPNDPRFFTYNPFQLITWVRF